MSNLSFKNSKKKIQIQREKKIKIHRGSSHHFFDLSRGGGFLGIRKRARIGCMSHRAAERDRRKEKNSHQHNKNKHLSVALARLGEKQKT